MVDVDATSVAAKVGRWAETTLRQADGAHAALEAVRRAQVLLADGAANSLYPKLRHVEAMALREVGGGDPAALDREAWTISLDQAPAEAILFAAEWGDWAWRRERWDEAAEAYDNAHRAMRRFLLRQVGTEADRLELLANTQYASRGAYALARVGRTRDAILLLERACDLVFSRNANERDMRRLLDVDPALRARLDAAFMDPALRTRGKAEQFGLDDLGNLTPRARAAQRALDAVVLEIRGKPGFGMFALPSGWTDVQLAVAQGPLVYLVPTDQGTLCLAVVQTPAAEIRAAQLALDAGLAQLQAAARDYIDTEFGEPRQCARAPLSALLDWLGGAVMAPVRDALTALGHGDGPITLRPFGMLAYLPLHQATVAGASMFAPGTAAYAYSARSLWASLARITEPVPAPSVVIDNPRPLPPAFDPLRLARFEAEMVAARHPGTVLEGTKATTTRVRAAMPGAGLIHFACHGTVDSRIGYAGVLMLANFEELTAEQLRQISGISARLVVLSACRSGAAGITVEHTMSLPAAFLAAGARAVIGTFWHADEMATLLLIAQFYALWPAEPDVRVALGAAQDWLRSTRADALRVAMVADALASVAGATLRDADAAALPYAHPWYWAGFFVAGA